MPPVTMRLSDARQQILAAARTRLGDGAEPGGLIEGVSKIVTGDRERARPKPPYLWLAIERMDADHRNHAIHERWVARLAVLGFVSAEDPEDGYEAATELVENGQELLLASRDLGLEFVTDVVSRDVMPSNRDFSHGRRHGAVARVDVSFTIVRQGA